VDEKYLGILKNIPRVGWLQRGIPDSIAESIAEHSFEVSFWSLWIIKDCENIDKFKVLAMSIIHDFSEAVLGDIPRSALNEETLSKLKKKIELRIGKKLLDDDKLFSLFKEYIEGKTQEALIVEIADEISTAFQSYRYRKIGYETDDILSSTINNVLQTLEKIKIDCIRIRVKEIIEKFLDKKI